MARFRAAPRRAGDARSPRSRPRAPRGRRSRRRSPPARRCSRCCPTPSITRSDTLACSTCRPGGSPEGRGAGHRLRLPPRRHRPQQHRPRVGAGQRRDEPARRHRPVRPRARQSRLRPSGAATTRDTGLNEWFSFADAAAVPSFGGAFEAGKLDNTYRVFEAGGHAWIALLLEWGPRDEVVAWADAVMTAHPDRLGILVTHAYLDNNDRRYDHGDELHPQKLQPARLRRPRLGQRRRGAVAEAGPPPPLRHDPERARARRRHRLPRQRRRPRPRRPPDARQLSDARARRRGLPAPARAHARRPHRPRPDVLAAARPLPRRRGSAVHDRARRRWSGRVPRGA